MAGRGEGHIDFEGFRKIYDAIMTVKEVGDGTERKAWLHLSSINWIYNVDMNIKIGNEILV